MEQRIRIRHFNIGSCNGCDIEVLAALQASDRLQLVSQAERADLLLVTGAMTAKNAERVNLEGVENGLPVVLVGACAASQGVFSRTPESLPSHLEPDSTELMVAVYGCPPSPAAIVSAVLHMAEREVCVHGDA